MKKIIILLLASVIATTATAQSENSGNANSSASSTNFFSSMSTKDYNRFYISYNPVKANIAGVTASIVPFKNSISFGYLHGLSLSKNIPLFLELGANYQYTFGKTYDDGDVDEFQISSLNIPLNLAFKIQFNDAVSLTPYVGPNFRINLNGKHKYTYKKYLNYYDDRYELVSESESLFGNSGDSANRFQPGINFGIGFSYKELYLGVGYIADLSGLYKQNEDTINAKLRFITLTLGVNFR